MEITIGIVLATAGIAIYAAARSLFKVEEGHHALVSAFGAVRRANGRPVVLGAGLHARWPWEQVHEFSVMERVMDVREDSREVEVLARDGTLLRIDPRIRFAFLLESAETFVFGMRRPLMHLREYYRCLVGAEIARFGDENSQEGSYGALRRSRRAFHEGLRLREGDAERRYGIGFRSADLVEILPPADLAEALNSVQKADAQNETLLRRVQAECDQRLVSAEHGLEISELHAEAAEKEIEVLGEAVRKLYENGSLSSYVQRRRDEAASASKTLYLRT